MKRTVIIVFATLLAAAAIVVGVRFLGGDEGTWICINGEWVKHGILPLPSQLCLAPAKHRKL